MLHIQFRPNYFSTSFDLSFFDQTFSTWLYVAQAWDQWVRGNQKMDFKERATSIQIGKVNLIPVYQPVSNHGETEIEAYRMDAEDLPAEVPRGNLLVIGGDHNSKISRGSERPGTAGPLDPHQ